MEPNELELLKFHWEKWQKEANRFWKHLIFATLALLALCLYQLDVLQFEFENAKLLLGPNTPFVKRWLVTPISLWFWLSIFFSLVDFLRHRVPERFESHIHNNTYPLPWSSRTVDLKTLARQLYLIVVVLFLGITGFWVIYCSLYAWA